MTDSTLTALVVDDDPIARRAVMLALLDEQFQCTPSFDGVDALVKFNQHSYDLVVTDLCMPNKHGHALIVELLEDSKNGGSMVVVHTGLDDPKMTKDLMLRGVDDVIYKPANYAAFAAKMRGAVLHRRRMQHQWLTPVIARATQESPEPPIGAVKQAARITELEFEKRLTEVGNLLPISNAPIEVLNLLRSDDYDALSLARIIENDAVLTAELLRLANQGIGGPPQRRVVKLSEAIARLGSKRIGEISLAVGALGGIANLVLPWFNKEIAQQRSLAGCLAAKRLLEWKHDECDEEGIVFAALMYPLSRVVVGCAFATVYETMIMESRQKSIALSELEQDVFPYMPAAAAALVLQRMGVPAEICLPLRFADLPMTALKSLPKSRGTTIQLLKIAVQCGELAVDQWNSWEVPPADTVDARPASIDGFAINELVEEIRRGLKSPRPPAHEKKYDQ